VDELTEYTCAVEGLRSYRDDRETEIRAVLTAMGEATGLPRPATLADVPGAVRAALFEQGQRLKRVEAERDRWKARAEAWHGSSVES
jgi:hypothetical protein